MSAREVIARPARTAAQLAVSAAVIEFVDVFVVNFDDRQYAAALALLTLVVGYVQVLVENRVGKALLRKVPERVT